MEVPAELCLLILYRKARNPEIDRAYNKNGSPSPGKPFATKFAWTAPLRT